MVGGGTTETSVMPKERTSWLEELLKRKSQYQTWAERYYRNHRATNSFYIEVTRDGTIQAYDGWSYKRGLKLGKKNVGQAQFVEVQVDRDKWVVELASVMCFARRARKQYGWNVIPVLDGYELEVRQI